MTFLELAEQVIELEQKPMSPEEIWNIALENSGIDTSFSKGKTPINTLSAKLYVDIKDNQDTIFYKTGIRPTKFFLKSLGSFTDDINVDDTNVDDKNKTSEFDEKDLHPLLVKFISDHQHFKALAKTINASKSSKSRKGTLEWLHPDIVGVYFPFDDYEKIVLDLSKEIYDLDVKFYSFELKKAVNFSNLRECYFQAISNSSWSHEGYLVAADFSMDNEFNDELRRLNSVFGIGVIKLSLDNIEESEILIPARKNTQVDWSTINILAKKNDDFKNFLQTVINSLKVMQDQGIAKVNFDKVFNDSELETYMKEKNFSKKN